MSKIETYLNTWNQTKIKLYSSRVFPANIFLFIKSFVKVIFIFVLHFFFFFT